MKIAIYTCVVGGYDVIRKPLSIEENCDYYMISDDRKAAGDVYKWIDIDMVVPNSNLSPKDKNRYCKLHPHNIFSDYDYAIYIDGSIQIVKPISHNIDKVGTIGIAIHKHRERDCIYSEGIFLYCLGVVDKVLLLSDMNRYIDAGLPKHFGMFECGMIITDLHNLKANELYSRWYEEYLKGIKRDQQALIYVLWEMGYDITSIGILGGKYSILTNPEISWNRSAHYK